jgi:signal transduction histidine kinase
MRRATVARYGSRMADHALEASWRAPVDRALAWRRRWLNQTTLDLGLALFVGTFGVLSFLVPRVWGFSRPGGQPGFAPLDVIGFALALLMTVPIASRRQAPVPVLIIVGGATVAASLLGFDSSLGGFTVLFALYTVAAHTDRQTSAQALGVTAVGLAISLIGSAANGRVEGVGIDAYIANLLLYSIAWLVGDNMRERRAYTRELEVRNARLERDREVEAARAVADERGRIARELHDVVTHGVTVMTVQASAARRVLRAAPDDAEAALATIESTGRDALVEMRRLLGVLRSDDDGVDRAPQPGLEMLPELIAQTEAAGLPVTTDVDLPPQAMSAGVDLTVYRVVQEALTNALRHAGPAARATVRIRSTPETLSIEVTDDGRGAAAAVAPGSGTDHPGHGLIGMRERVALVGGELEIGPRPEGGYRVAARIPLGVADGTPR